MPLLLNVIMAGHARSTHHKLALDALLHLQGADSDRWADVLISQHVAYLQGAKAPDDDFRDFKNHVLHVRENYWGGAVKSANHWYGQLIDHLRAAEWKDAAYAAGVLSHYYSDPLMPFHTGQSESEGAVHRAAEWSVTKSYEKLRDLIRNEIGGYPQVPVPATPEWLSEMVCSGARMSNQYYELLIDHYNLALGVKDPPAGLDRVAQEAVARCLAHATIGLAGILERAFAESAVSPPEVNLTMQAVLATANVPIRTIINKLADAQDRRAVEAIYREVQETGKAVHSLPESERLVRQFHAAEVLRVPLSKLDAEKARPAGQKFVPSSDGAATAMPQAEGHSASIPMNLPAGVTIPATPADSVAIREIAGTRTESSVQQQSAAAFESESTAGHLVPSGTSALRLYLTADAPIVDAPSIGPRTAARFHEIGMLTVASFVNSDPVETAQKLATRHITADVLRDWQAQSNLMLSVPGLRGHDAQLLVAADVRDRETLERASADQLLAAIVTIAATSEGRRILRDSSEPDLEEVTGWINASRLPDNQSALKAA